MGKRVKLPTKSSEAKRQNSVSRTQKVNLSQSKTGPDGNIFFLRAIGNQGVQRLLKSEVIQAKLTIGRPGDIYEQEADKVAEQVMGMPDSDLQMKAA